MEPLLISIAQAAEILGGLSVRHVYRLIQDEGLPVVLIGKRKKAIPVKDLNEWIDSRRPICYNKVATEPVAKKEKPWGFTNGRIRTTKQSGGSLSQTQAVKELGDRLKHRKKRRQKV